MQFKDVINQQQTKKDLIGLFNSGRLPHALLFLGKEGVGGLPMAMAFVQYLFCEHKTETDSCGVCNACTKIKKLAHPDLHLTFPTIGAKPNLSKNFLPQFREFFLQTPYADTYDWLQFIQAGNKQGKITADECRDIVNRLNLTAFESGYKVQIIWRPEFLGKEGNILLKLIEEPPPQTLLLLVAEEEKQILNTILSRTQKIMLPPLRTHDIATALTERHQIAEQQALSIAHVAEGSYARALALLLSSGQNDWVNYLKEWLNAIFTFNAVKTSQWVDKMAKEGRTQQKHFLMFAQEILAHAFRLTVAPEYQPPLVADELSLAQKLAHQKLSVATFDHINKGISDAIYHIERNTHAKTQLLYLSLQIQYLIKGKILQANSEQEMAASTLPSYQA